jgi:hypothetical protein
VRDTLPFPVMVAVFRRIVELSTAEVPGLRSVMDQRASGVRDELATAGLPVSVETAHAFLCGMLVLRHAEETQPPDAAFAELAYGAVELAHGCNQGGGS